MLIFPKYRSALVSHVLRTDTAVTTLLLWHQFFFLFWLQYVAELDISATESSDDKQQLMGWTAQISRSQKPRVTRKQRPKYLALLKKYNLPVFDRVSEFSWFWES